MNRVHLNKKNWEVCSKKKKKKGTKILTIVIIGKFMPGKFILYNKTEFFLLG